ncbi:MAG: DNA-binding protein HU [Pelotomaculum sp. PtaU1.Bin035]|nr:MAG: DNA-binding protein HU [Pelotomaculum sp. PtaU1.Bin035]
MTKMIKIDLARAMAQKTGTTLKTADRFLEAFVEAVGVALERGEKVQLAGFGTFEVRSWGERPGRNPRTGEELVVPAGRHPAFRAGKKLKERLAVNLSKTPGSGPPAAMGSGVGGGCVGPKTITEFSPADDTTAIEGIHEEVTKAGVTVPTLEDSHSSKRKRRHRRKNGDLAMCPTTAPTENQGEADADRPFDSCLEENCKPV